MATSHSPPAAYVLTHIKKQHSTSQGEHSYKEMVKCYLTEFKLTGLKTDKKEIYFYQLIEEHRRNSLKKRSIMREMASTTQSNIKQTNVVFESIESV